MDNNEVKLDFSQAATATEATTNVEKQAAPNYAANDTTAFAFGKTNFILIGISMLIVVIGFVMMTGAESTTTHFEPEIFSSMRVKVAPVVCLVGFLSIICGILYRPKAK